MNWLRAIVLAAVLCLGATPANSQTCARSGEDSKSWHNPHPEPGDYTLPLPLGLSLVFSPVPLGAKGLYGDEKSTYEMGSSKAKLFETKLLVRVGSSISNRRGEAMLLFGKYELTKAQYAVVMGAGNLKRGLEVLRKRSRDERTHQALDAYLDRSAPCYRKITRALHRHLAEPLTFLSYRDYVEFIDTFNLQCIRRRDCRARLTGLGLNDDVQGFIRLPYEHEWEFVARGGRDYVTGRIGRTELQADLPPIPAGKRITAYAHVENDPPRVLPIGSREALFGLYDMYGNAQELMDNKFTAENGYGAVGGYVARGGHYQLSADELRASRRVELRVFRLDEKSGEPQIQYFPRTGIRLAIGYPVEGAAESLVALAAQEKNRVAPEEAGDNAGNSLAEARDVGAVRDRPIKLTEELDRDDSEDWYRFRLLAYGRLTLQSKAGRALSFEFRSSSKRLAHGSGSRTARTGNLMPGEYYLRVSSVSRRLVREEKYEVMIGREVAADTGDRFDPSSLPKAYRLAGTRELRREGFVGRTDPIDSYAVKNTSYIEGLELVLDAPVPLTLRYADARLNTVAEIAASDAKMPITLPISQRAGSSGFVQVEAGGQAQAVYRLTVRPKLPYDKVFSKTYSEKPSRVATAGRSYEANISGSQSLYLPIRIGEMQVVRVELTDLTDDVAMSVIGPRRRAVSSNHGRNGARTELFSEILEPGVYNVFVKMKERGTRSTLRLSFTVEEVPESALSPAQLRERARKAAYALGPVGNETYRTGTVSEDNVYYHFQVFGGRKYVVIDLRDFTATSDLDLFLEGSHGHVLAKSANSGDEAERIARIVGSGTYYIRLERAGSGSQSSFRMWVSALGSMKDRPYTSPGTAARSSDGGTGQVHRKEDHRCTAFTVARSTTPELGWREYRPVFRCHRISRRVPTCRLSMDLSWGLTGAVISTVLARSRRQSPGTALSGQCSRGVGSNQSPS